MDGLLCPDNLNGYYVLLIAITLQYLQPLSERIAGDEQWVWYGQHLVCP